MSQYDKSFSLPEKEENTPSPMKPQTRAVNNNNQAPLLHQSGPRAVAKYCHHGFVPAYCAHCKYGAPVEWK